MEKMFCLPETVIWKLKKLRFRQRMENKTDGNWQIKSQTKKKRVDLKKTELRFSIMDT